jgi:hypothetical protein
MYIQFTSVKAFISIMHHKENFDWSRTQNGVDTLHTSNATTVNRNDTCFGIRKVIVGGV